MATAWPVHAMSTGVGNERSRSASSKPPRSMPDASEPPPLSTARSNPAENAMYGDMESHAERYARTREFIAIMRDLWRGVPVDHESIRAGDLLLANLRAGGINIADEDHVTPDTFPCAAAELQWPRDDHCRGLCERELRFRASSPLGRAWSR